MIQIRKKKGRGCLLSTTTNNKFFVRRGYKRRRIIASLDLMKNQSWEVIN